MTRVVTATAGSVVAVIALIGAKAATGDDAPPALPDLASANSHPTNSQATNAGAPVPNPSTAAQAPAATGSGASGTFTGDSVRTPYGPVQVEITVTGGQISDIRTVQCPTATPRDQMICQQAVPYLVQESLAAQSANVNSISGATYTSEGYMQSLQSAIDKAGL